MVSYPNEVGVSDPNAHEYRVRIRPAGVHDLGAGSLGLDISLMEWIAHAIFRRGKWLIEVLDPHAPGNRNPVWAKGGYSTGGAVSPGTPSQETSHRGAGRLASGIKGTCRRARM